MSLPDLLSGTPGYNGLVKARHGWMVYNRNDSYIGRSVAKYGEWGELEFALLNQICGPGDNVVDVGANIGTHALALARTVGNTGLVYAFEPQRAMFHLLCANAALNGIEHMDTQPLALADRDGQLTVPPQRYDLEANFGGLSLTNDSTGVRVATRRLDDVIDPPRLRLIKADVEGMEQAVIEGARRLIHRHRPFLYLENDRIERSKALIESVFTLDYRLFWHITPLFNLANFAGDPEDVFQGIASFNMLGVHRSVDLQTETLAEITDSSHHPLMEARG